ncbi:MAG: PspA/IM30 family protein [Chloroflexota bacterium]|nr:PspA/IM30 family protein [Chloroflexota bacterium]
MGVLERLSTLLRANINDMLDQAEDPEIMLSQILRDMEGELQQARSQVAEMMAQERIVRDDLQAERDKAQHMEERAMHYVGQGNDTLAREALKRKSDADANAEVLQQQLNAQSEMVGRLRSQLDALQDKYQQALNNRDALIARHRRVRTQQQMTNTARNLDVTDYSSDLSRMEQRIRMAEARSDADRQLQADADGEDVDSVFDTTERNARIDDQLAALKQRMGLSGSSGGGGGGGGVGSSSGSWGEAPRNEGTVSDTSEPGSIDGGPDTRRIGMAQGGQ